MTGRAGDIRGILRRAHSAPTTCPAGKLQYVSEKEANRALRAVRRRGGPNTKDLAVYKCRLAECRRFHLGHGLGKDP